MASIILLLPHAIKAKPHDSKDKNLKIVMQFEGDKETKEEIDALAQNIELTAKEFKTTSHLSYWDNEGKNLITKIFHSKGYYNPIITSEIEEDADSYKHYQITFNIFPANRYLLSNIEIIHDEGSNKDILLPSASDLPTKIKIPAEAEVLLANQSIILNKIEKDNCLLSLSIRNEAIINHREHTVSIKYIVKAGQVAKIGEVNFTGMKTVDEEFLRKVVSLEPGECFKNSNIVKVREKLQATGLFASTKSQIPDEVDDDGAVPIVFKLKERKHRSVKAGIGYGTDLGFGLNVGWKHRNFFSQGEELSFDAFFNQKEQFAGIDYIKPYFLRDNQKLIGNFAADNSTHKAFDSKEVKFSLGIERAMVENIDVGMAGKITFSQIKDKASGSGNKKSEDEFILLSIPTYLKFDKRDNVVNSRKGHYIHGVFEPFYGLNSDTNIFVKNTLQGRYYINLGFHRKSVIALKGQIGSIWGDGAVNEIPATERFYLGGGNSVRGYAFQAVGPYDMNRRVPTGGRSFLEGSLEYRFMREDNIGFAIFYDIGNVYRNHIPDFKNRKMFSSVGLGLRYDTDFGPIRVDVAFPNNRRKGIDDAFQLYFGIGQSF